jgi:hypothetical protein
LYVTSANEKMLQFFCIDKIMYGFWGQHITCFCY